MAIDSLATAQTVACAMRTKLLHLSITASLTMLRYRFTPINRINTSPHKAVKTRIRPVRRLLDIPMLDGIPMNIRRVSFGIVVITDLVLPEPALPQAELRSFGARGAAVCRQQMTCLPAYQPFNHVPAQCIISIAVRQRPDTMKMIGQQHKRVDLKRMGLPDGADTLF